MHGANSSTQNRLALNALTSNDATSILRNPAVRVKDIHVFSDKIELEGFPVTNQASSGRCWLFAATNVFRIALMNKFKLKEFQLSQVQDIHA
jgi:bleomycin hydrolase